MMCGQVGGNRPSLHTTGVYEQAHQMGEGYRGLPEPIAVPIPTAIGLQTDFGKEMMKQKAPVPFKIPKGLIMVVRFVPPGKRFA